MEVSAALESASRGKKLSAWSAGAFTTPPPPFISSRLNLHSDHAVFKTRTGTRDGLCKCRFKRLSHGADRASVLELTSGPELADNPYAARLFELHDSDRDGMITWNEFLAAIDAMSRLGSDDERTECELRSTLLAMRRSAHRAPCCCGPLLPSSIVGMCEHLCELCQERRCRLKLRDLGNTKHK